MHSRRVFPGRPFCMKGYAPENLFNRPPPKAVQYFLIGPVIPHDKKILTSSDTNEYVSTKYLKIHRALCTQEGFFSGRPFCTKAYAPENLFNRPPPKVVQYFLIGPVIPHDKKIWTSSDTNE